MMAEQSGQMGAVFAPSLEGFEGPLDLLLSLVRDKQMNIGEFSVADLAQQYSAFLATVPPEELQRAAEYLLMASWLAMLKSRLLLPDLGASDDEDDPIMMAERLALQMRKLSAMQRVAQALQNLPQLGKQFFPSGEAQELQYQEKVEYQADLMSLLRAIRGVEDRLAHGKARLKVSELPLLSIDAARRHLQALLCRWQEWQAIDQLLPDITYAEILITSDNSAIYNKSCYASTFMAALEMQREGDIEIQQVNLQSTLQIRWAEGVGI